jgi:hypothetical protein
MREKIQEIKEAFKCRLVDCHRDMFFFQDDAMLVVVAVRRILEEEVFPVELKGDNPVVRASGLGIRPVEAFVFLAEGAKAGRRKT